MWLPSGICYAALDVEEFSEVWNNYDVLWAAGQKVQALLQTGGCTYQNDFPVHFTYTKHFI